MYQCTYPGCHEQRLSVDAIESHVRVEHLNRPEELDLSIDEADRDHEEEFYYTETEFEEVIDVEPPQLQVSILRSHHWYFMSRFKNRKKNPFWLSLRFVVIFHVPNFRMIMLCRSRQQSPQWLPYWRTIWIWLDQRTRIPDRRRPAFHRCEGTRCR